MANFQLPLPEAVQKGTAEDHTRGNASVTFGLCLTLG